MRLFVLDASAWLRLFLADGPPPAGLDEAAAEVDAGAAAFVAPELILVETAHALHRKTRRQALTPGEVDELWSDMRRTPIDLLRDAEHVDAARQLAARLDITVYDALYLAVARHVGAPLFTADEQLARAAHRG